MTIIAGLPVNITIALFVELRCSHRGEKHRDLPSESWCMSGPSFQNHHGVDEQPEGMDMDPTCSLFTTGNVWGNPTYWHLPAAYNFFHTVLNCRADGKCPW